MITRGDIPPQTAVPVHHGIYRASRLWPTKGTPKVRVYGGVLGIVSLGPPVAGEIRCIARFCRWMTDEGRVVTERGLGVGNNDYHQCQLVREPRVRPESDRRDGPDVQGTTPS